MFRKILISLTAFLLSFSLFLGLTTYAVTSFTANRSNIKQTLQESGIYDNLVDSVLEETKKQAKPGEKSEFPIDNPEVQARIKQALPPQFWQTAAENIIDGIYAWLEGDSSKLIFTIDLKQAKTNLMNSVADYGVARIDALPACTSPDQISDPNDVFNLACKPPDFNPVEAKQKIIAEAENSDFLGDKDAFTAADLKSDDGQAIEEKLVVVKESYTWSKRLPIMLFILATLLSIGLFFLHSDRVKALSRLRTIFVSSGAAILIFSGIAWFVFKKVTAPGLKFGDGVSSKLQTSAVNAANSVFDSIITVFFIGGAIYLVIGMIFWLVVRKMSPPLTEEQRQNNVNKVLRTKGLADDDAVKLDDAPSLSSDESKDETK